MRSTLLPIGVIFAMTLLKVAAVATSETLWETEAVAVVLLSWADVAELGCRK